MNELNDYERFVRTKINHSLPHTSQIYSALLGLSGEAGEICNMIKKHFFHGHWYRNIRDIVMEECGDVLFYIVWLCGLWGITLEEVIQYNKDKLSDRYPEGFDERRSVEREVHGSF